MRREVITYSDRKNSLTGTRGMLAAVALAVNLVIPAAGAQAQHVKEKAAATTGKPPVTAAPVRYKPDRFAGRAGKYYALVWGVDSLGVKTVESGQLIRFTYRVLDADKAKALNNKGAEPLLNAPRAGVQLVVPKMEKIGPLRQSSTPEAGKSYWMAFSNRGRLVKRGDRVSVVIGQFRADGLVVD